MLRRLEIENFGLIDRAEIEFATGATMFTGETGSGKTMLVGALEFVLGARAGADVVRHGAGKASVTLAFDPTGALAHQLTRDGFEIDAGEEATIVREMSDGGRSSVRVNGRPSTAGYVREAAAAIAEIVGQHEAQRLLSPTYHLELLDRFGGEKALRAREAVAKAHARAAELAAELAALQGDERAARERYDLACFGLREIDDARLEPGEDRRLDERRRYLDNVERIAAALRRAQEALAADEAGAAATLGAAAVALAGIAPIGAELASMAERAAALQSEANDLAAFVARALESTEFDPNELESINARLDRIDRLKRKYGSTIDEILEYGRRARAAVDEFEGRDRRGNELAAAVAAAARDLGSAALALT